MFTEQFKHSTESSVHAGRGSGFVSELAHKAANLFDGTVQQFAGELEINVALCMRAITENLNSDE